ncbi:MAG: hypothetical protein HUU14_12305 [Dehalococcoidia bacterium]|nr:hypothetical protein [Dehalococcoidia bacterium]NUQ56662.1 hypothetical protein [Dehalococcoidia bacterium]
MTAPNSEPPARWDGWLGPRTWAPIAAILVVAAAALAVLYFFERGEAEVVTRPCQPGDPGCELRQRIHEHADFALFIRGERFDFHKDQFVSVEGKELSPNAHIHDPRYTVIHVHREQTTWDEFFRSLGFELSDTCIKLPSGESLCNNDRETLKFVVNGVRVDTIMFEDIQGLSRVLISYGPESKDEVMGQYATVTDEACIPAGVCRERGTGAGEHGEPCTIGDNSCN